MKGTGMRILDLFCGAGGAAMGIHRAVPDAEIIGVDMKPQKHYPFTFVLADAMTFPLEGYDFIWASPPCQGYMTMGRFNQVRFGSRPLHPRLIEALRPKLSERSIPYVIENVQGAPLQTQIILCGFSLGLSPLARHRHFESNRLLFAPPCSHRGKGTVGVYGRLTPRWIKKTVAGKVSTRSTSTIDEARHLMGINWMDWDELREAVPPAYSEFIVRQMFP